MNSNNIIPVLVGVAQLVNKDRDSAGEPLDYMHECARRAADDAGNRDILRIIDSLSFVNVISRNYTDEPKKLAEMLGATPKEIIMTTIGATSPQALTSRLCDRISMGESEIGLICGAEAFYTSKNKPNWTAVIDPQYNTSVTLYGDMRPAVSPIEYRYGLFMPSVIYPLFANAFRKSQGETLEESIRKDAALCERYSSIAKDNDYAWFRDGKSASEISTVSQKNPMINYPYTKFMNAMMNVDQGTALIIMSEKKADSLKIPQEKRVYLIGCGDAYEKWLISDRVNYYSAPGLEIACSRAFMQAGIGKEEVDFWDFYNCFPIAARIAIKTLDLSESIMPTVTGGLPYFGGPGNNYSMHAICQMVELLRKYPEKKGLVHSLSWFMSKYSVGIYSGIRPEKFQRLDPEEYMHDIDKRFPDVTILEDATGIFEIETYTVSYNRSGEPVSAIIIAKNGKGERLFAVNDTEVTLMTSMTMDEPIGKKARIFHDPSDGLHRFTDIL
jgi:acetyl-CoA C-acetyltransferase